MGREMERSGGVAGGETWSKYIKIIIIVIVIYRKCLACGDNEGYLNTMCITQTSLKYYLGIRRSGSCIFKLWGKMENGENTYHKNNKIFV